MSFLTNPKFIFMCLIFAGVILEVFGDVFFKKWSIDGRVWILVVGLLIYFSGAYFWAMSLKYEGLAIAVSVFTIMNMILASLIGVFYFSENLGLVNKVGIGLGILSVLLIEWQ